MKENTIENALETIAKHGLTNDPDVADMLANALIDHASQFRPKWISVEERLPDNLTHCIANNGIEYILCNYRNDKFYRIELPFGNTTTMAIYCHNITHWQPLPDPPSQPTT